MARCRTLLTAMEGHLAHDCAGRQLVDDRFCAVPVPDADAEHAGNEHVGAIAFLSLLGQPWPGFSSTI